MSAIFPDPVLTKLKRSLAIPHKQQRDNVTNKKNKDSIKLIPELEIKNEVQSMGYRNEFHSQEEEEVHANLPELDIEVIKYEYTEVEYLETEDKHFENSGSEAESESNSSNKTESDTDSLVGRKLLLTQASEDETWEPPKSLQKLTKLPKKKENDNNVTETVTIALPNYKTAMKSKKCFVFGCGSTRRGRPVPKYLKRVLLENYNFYVPPFARVCDEHVREYYCDWSFLKDGNYRNVFTSEIVASMLDLLKDCCPIDSD